MASMEPFRQGMSGISDPLNVRFAHLSRPADRGKEMTAMADEKIRVRPYVLHIKRKA